jgi:hypothetical protein
MYLTENDTLSNSEQAVQRHQNVVFVLFVLTVHVELPDPINGEFFAFELDFVRVWRKLACIDTHVVRECC